MVTAALLAGGTGARMGSDVPKQYLEIGGKPIIIHSAQRFIESGLIDGMLVAAAGEYLEYARSFFEKFLPDYKNIKFLTGGATRSDTLMNILSVLHENGASGDDIVLTHDAVRPFITKQIIESNIAAARQFGACSTCVPAVDTVFISAEGQFIDSVPERRTVYHAQTPQSFRAEELYTLCRGIPADVFSGLTDGCSVYTYYGKKVAMVPGSTRNIKITYPEDIKKAEIFLKGE